MSDIVDEAQQLEAEHLVLSLSAARVPIPAGEPGECDNCFEYMPRLVRGLCGFCRDGRRPLRAVPGRRPVVTPTPAKKEESVAAYKDGKYVAAPCEARVLKRIERLASRSDVSLGVAALELIEAGIRALDAPPPMTIPEAIVDPHDGSDASISAWLEHVSNALLTAEIDRRMGEGVAQIEFDAAIARAVASEGQLATLREQLRGLLDVPALAGGGGR